MPSYSGDLVLFAKRLIRRRRRNNAQKARQAEKAIAGQTIPGSAENNLARGAQKIHARGQLFLSEHTRFVHLAIRSPSISRIQGNVHRAGAGANQEIRQPLRLCRLRRILSPQPVDPRLNRRIQRLFRERQHTKRDLYTGGHRGRDDENPQARRRRQRADERKHIARFRATFHIREFQFKGARP